MTSRPAGSLTLTPTKSATAQLRSRTISTPTLPTTHRVSSLNNSRTPVWHGSRGNVQHQQQQQQQQQQHGLIEAVLAGDEARVRTALAAGAQVGSTVDSRGRPLLCVLVEHGASPALLKILLERLTTTRHGVVNQCMPANRQTALHIAAKNGYQVCVNQLLAAGAEINCVDASGNTALLLSAQNGRLSTVRELLHHGANPNVANSAGITVLHAAARNGHLECVRTLLDESNCEVTVCDVDGRTPLMLAAMANQTDVAHTLLDVDDRAQAINACDPQTGQSILHWAVYHGSVPLVSRLLRLKVDLESRDREWRTPFFIAVITQRLDIIPLLVNAGCKTTTLTDRSFNTPLHIACRDGLSQLVALLLNTTSPSTDNCECEVNLKGPGGVTPLMLAANGGHASIVAELLRRGADPAMVDRHRATALVHALLTPATFIEPCPSIVKSLIRYNCDVNAAANVRAMCKSMNLPRSVQKMLESLEDQMYAPIEITFLLGQTATFSILLQAGCDFSRLCITPWDASSEQSTDLLLSLTEMTSAQKIMKRLLHPKPVPSLKVLCRRPSLRFLLADRDRQTLPEVISGLRVDSAIKRFLGFPELDDCSEAAPTIATNERTVNSTSNTTINEPIKQQSVHDNQVQPKTPRKPNHQMSISLSVVCDSRSTQDVEHEKTEISTGCELKTSGSPVGNSRCSTPAGSYRSETSSSSSPHIYRQISVGLRDTLAVRGHNIVHRPNFCTPSRRPTVHNHNVSPSKIMYHQSDVNGNYHTLQKRTPKMLMECKDRKSGVRLATPSRIPMSVRRQPSVPIDRTIL